MGEGEARPLRSRITRGRRGTRRSRGSAASACATSSPSIAGARPDSILFISHRDNSGVGPGANDNASGTAALIELVRGYGRLGTIAGRPKPQHTLIFLSSDGGAFGGFGAERFASTSPLRAGVRAVVSLDALAGTARPRLETAGFAPRSPAPALVRTADVRVAAQLGRSPARPGWLAQLVALGMPFGYGEQAPFLGRKISAIRLGNGGRQRWRRGKRHDGPSRSRAVRATRECRRVHPGVARRRDRACRRDGGVCVSRQPDHSRLGDRVRPSSSRSSRFSSAPSTSSPAAAGGVSLSGAPGGRSARASAYGSGSVSSSALLQSRASSPVDRRFHRRPTVPLSPIGLSSGLAGRRGACRARLVACPPEARPGCAGKRGRGARRVCRRASRARSSCGGHGR